MHTHVHHLPGVRLWQALVLLSLGYALAAHAAQAQQPKQAPRAQVTAISAGGDHTCALLSIAQVKYWGENHAGELWLGGRVGRSVGCGDEANEMGDARCPRWISAQQSQFRAVSKAATHERNGSTMSELGFIGLGIMGRAMSRHWIRAGHRVHVYSAWASSREAIAAAGGLPCAQAQELAERTDVIVLMVKDAAAVERVLFGDRGVSSAKPSARERIVVCMSTIAPAAARDFAQRLAAYEIAWLDAPVSGGEVGAQQASLSIMVGGKEEVFSRVRPYLELLGKNINRVGEAGAGQVAKVANQIIVALTIEAVGEALLFASRAGANPEKVRQALLGGFAQSRILELHGRRMIQRDFRPGGTVAIQQKDNQIALDEARAMGLPLPLLGRVQQLYHAVAAAGGIDLDHSALLLAIEQLAGCKVG